jgi:hypothetical protein
MGVENTYSGSRIQGQKGTESIRICNTVFSVNIFFRCFYYVQTGLRTGLKAVELRFKRLDWGAWIRYFIKGDWCVSWQRVVLFRHRFES